MGDTDDGECEREKLKGRKRNIEIKFDVNVHYRFNFGIAVLFSDENEEIRRDNRHLRVIHKDMKGSREQYYN